MPANRSIPSELVAELASQEGFDAAGIAAAPAAGSPEDYAELQHFEPWIDAGRAGEMQYLKRRDDAGRMLRSSLRTPMPWARSVIVCAANYNAAAPRSIDPAPEDSGWIARYAWSGQEHENGGLQPSDYHKVLLRRLERIEQRLRELVPEGGDGIQTRSYVDTGPVVERVYAKYAGIGWIGKNTCILNEQLGSWLFLGVIVTSLDLAQWTAMGTRSELVNGREDLSNQDAAFREPGPGAEFSVVAADRCGSCTRCIDACPTNALDEPYRMDASLCISYLTIEKRGEIAEPLRALMGRQVFGCDICQDVCPWNRKAPIGADAAMTPRPELVNPALEWLAELDEESFGRVFHGSPVKRTKLSGLRRNVAIAMGNSGLRKFLPRLHQWAESEDAVLADSATWAIQSIERSRIGSSRPGTL